MRNLLPLALVCVFAIAAHSSCAEKKEGITQLEGPSQQAVWADGKSADAIKFKTNGAWSSTIEGGGATRDGTPWITIAPDRGSSAGNHTVEIALETNYSGFDRTATVTVHSGGDSFSVTVTQRADKADGGKPGQVVGVTGIGLNQTELTLTKGDTATLVATVEPANATNGSVGWSSDDTGVATVDAAGLVRAVGAGTATVTAVANDGGIIKTGCKITVKSANISSGGTIDDWGDGGKIEF